MNLTDVGMENFCTFHQQPHFEKNCPQWINSMTLVMNQLLDSKLTETGKEEEKDNKSTEKQEEDTFGSKKPLLLSKPKDEGSQDFEGMLKMMQKLSNRVIDLEKEKEAHKS